ncbi:hypothetical protein ACLB2K_046734 [Fragaria x ananassa]
MSQKREFRREDHRASKEDFLYSVALQRPSPVQDDGGEDDRLCWTGAASTLGRTTAMELGESLAKGRLTNLLATIECVPKDVLEVIDEDEEVILPAPAALDNTPPQVKDLIKKVNLGTEEDLRNMRTFRVCHRLSTIPRERSVQQEPWRMKTETTDTVKEEVEKMFKLGIIRVAKYNEWLSTCVRGCSGGTIASEDSSATDQSISRLMKSS